MGIRNKVTGEMYTITSYNPTTGNITGINNTTGNSDLGNVSNIYIGGGNPGEILSTDGAGNLSWIPDGGGASTGDITFNATTISAPNDENINIQALNNDGVLSSGITFRPSDTYTRWEQWGPQNNQPFTTADWTTGTYTTSGGTLGAVVFTNATNLIAFVNSLEGAGQIYFSVNGGPLLLSDGISAGGTGITFYTATLPATDPTTVTTFEYYYSYYSQVEIDYDAEEFNINTNNVDFILQTTNQKDIEINSSRQATLTGNGPISITNFSDNENVYITTDATDQLYQWQFGVDGNLTLPGNTFAVNYANGAQVLLDDIQSQIANGNSNVSVPTSNDNVYINVNGGTQKQWIFNTDGNLRTPGNVDIYGAINFPQQVSSINWSTYNIELSQYGRINTNVDFFANANVIGAQYLKGDGSNISNIAGANVTGEVALANTVSNPAQPNITSVGTLVSLTTGSLNTTGLFTANGNAQFNQDVYFAGNVTLPGNINQISGNSGSFFGDPATGFGALYVGLPTGYTLLDNEVAQFSDNFNGYTQVTHRNINGGDQATGDFVITADNGTDLVNHIDMGIAGSGYDGALANNSLGTALYPNDGYLYTRGNVTGGNLVLGSNQANGVVRIIANGASNIGNVVATFRANGLTVSSNVAASYFLGNGSQLTSIANGSNTQIQFNNDGNLAASANLTFVDSVAGGVVEVGTELTLLGNGTIGTSGSDLLLQPAGNLVAEVAGNDWTFDSTGNLTIPGSSGGLIKTVANASIGIVAMDNGTDNPAQLMSWNVGGGAPTSIISAYSTNATIQTNAAASINTWQFLANAVTVFPGDLIGSGASPAPSINGFNSASFSGNVTADYFIGNGSQLTGMYGNTNVAAYLPGYTGQLNRVTSISASGNINTSANINVTGNIYAAYVLGNGSQLTGLPAPVVTQDITSTGDMSIMTYDGNIKYVNNATIEPATGDIASAGNIVADWKCSRCLCFRQRLTTNGSRKILSLLI
jgi:hypothetical protein